jgi:hypothetical protein
MCSLYVFEGHFSSFLSFTMEHTRLLTISEIDHYNNNFGNTSTASDAFEASWL